MAQKSDAEVNEAVARILKEIAALEEQARERGLAFAGLSEEQVRKKLRGETNKSPFFGAMAWDQFTNSGSPSSAFALIENPDPELRLCVVTLFFGLVLDPDISVAIAARDTRWPYVSTELIFLEPGEQRTISFIYQVPYAPKGTYYSNAVLWQWNLFDPSTLLDRSLQMYLTLK